MPSEWLSNCPASAKPTENPAMFKIVPICFQRGSRGKVTMNGERRGAEARERKSDKQRPLVAMIQNGIGAFISRIMIVVVLPLVSLLAGYALKVTLDNITLRIAEVATSVNVLSADVSIIKANMKEASTDATTARDNVTMLKEHAAGTDRRLDNLEERRR